MKQWKSVDAVATVTVSTIAHGQSSTAQAETLFRQGKEFIPQGQIVGACAALDASQKLDLVYPILSSDRAGLMLKGRH